MIVAAFAHQGISQAQTPDAHAPWYGVPLPPAFEAHHVPVVLGDRPPEPARVAAVDGTAGELRMRLTLETESLSGLTAQNALAVIPGTSDEVVLIVAHADSSNAAGVLSRAC